MESEKDISNAIKRAESRAKIITSLDKAYESKEGQKKMDHSNFGVSSSGPQMNFRVKAATESLVGSTATSSRDFSYLVGLLENKSIVIDNSKGQLEASSSKSRVRLSSKRKKSVSHSFLKRHRLCDPMSVPSWQDLLSLHQCWIQHIRSTLSERGSQSSSGNQVLMRFQSASKIGSKVVVVDSRCKKLIGLSGILTTVSANCFYIARVKEDSRVATGQLQSASSDSALQVLRILQADVILGVYMPTMRRPDQKAKAEEKGKKTTEVIEADVVVDVSSSCCVEAGEEDISDVAQEEPEAVDDSLKYPSGMIVDIASVSVPTMRDIHECDSIQYDRVFLMYGRSFDPYSYVGSSL